MNYFKILKYVTSNNKSLFDIPVKEQQVYLDHFPEPRTDIERSFFQYECQFFFSPKWLIWFQNIVAVIIYPFAIFYFLLKSKPKNDHKLQTILSKDGIDENLIPGDLQGTTFLMSEGQVLGFKDIDFCFKVLCAYPCEPFFNLKILFKVAQYRYVIEKYNPKQIVVHAEYSFCSSVMTDYCNRLFIEHINIMHGEKLFYIRDSFFRFDKCYVWDEYYIVLFKLLRTGTSQFVVSLPKSLKFSTLKYLDAFKYVDYKYYLAANGEDELKLIVDKMLQLNQRGYSISIRPHPRYTNIQLLTSLIEMKFIESNDVSIESSIANTTNVISCYSTVLQQAYYAGKNVVIDDVVYEDKYEMLISLKYIMVNKPHVLLSNILQSR